MANVLGEEGQKTIKHTADDAELARELGLDGESASSAHSDLLEKARRLQRIQEQQREKIEEQRRELRRQERKYGLRD